MSTSKQLKHQWFLESLSKIKAGSGLNQKEIADKLGISSQMLSMIKSGHTPPPDALIEKMTVCFELSSPFFHTPYSQEAQKEIDELIEINRSYSDYLKEVNEILKNNLIDLRKNIEDLRNQSERVEDHVRTLKELNDLLKGKPPVNPKN